MTEGTDQRGTADRAGHPAPAAIPRPPAPPALPVWPLFLMFGLVPVWWLAGVFFLGWSLLAGLLLLVMTVRGRVPLPPATLLWVLFLTLVALSATRLPDAGALLTFGLRLGFYLSALVVCVYVYATARERGDLVPVLRPLTVFWLGLVVLGWVGVLAPRLAITTPMEMLLPGGLGQNPFMRDLVHVRASEYSVRSLNPIYRPAAPFPYTNNYGSAFAMTLPCVVAFTMLARRGSLRWVLMLSLPLSLPPAFLTLNRAMFLSLGVGLAVLGGLAVLRGNLRVTASILGMVVLGASAMVFIPITEMINQRVSASDTNTDRMSLYLEVIRRIGESPWLGFGAPADVDTVSAAAPVGSQGQLWMVLFSHGIPALLCFVGWFVVAFVRHVRTPSPAGQWLSVVPLICLVQMPFYGMASPNLAVALYAVGFTAALVERYPRVRRRAVPPRAGRPVGEPTGPPGPARPTALALPLGRPV